MMKKPGDTPVDPDATYLVATNNFLGTGGDGFLGFADPVVAKTYIDTHVLIRDIWIEAVKAGQSITAAIDNRIQPK